MRNKVVHRMARAIRMSGLSVLRFNFRGVGLSEGEHAQGIGEIEDARAALAWLRERNTDLPSSLAGFSFGSRVILKLGCELRQARLLLAAGMPTRRETLPFLSNCPVAKVFISSTQDEYAPQEELVSWFQEFAEPKQLVLIPARDHFFEGALDEFESAVRVAFGDALDIARGRG
jgi:alpha/beta superfamily hydrolase